MASILTAIARACMLRMTGAEGEPPLDSFYSRHFQSDAEARQYETGEYAPASYSSLLFEIECQQLQEVIAALRQAKPTLQCLDFASGTGRITAFLESHVDSVTGIEISPQMCEIARTKVRNARIVCTDILAPGAAIEGKYDLITAFRFFLNIEPSLRLAALRALANRLRDSDSLLVFNNHGNLWSHKPLLWPYHALRRLGRGRTVAGNYLSSRALLGLLPASGLQRVRTMGCGFYSPKILKLISYDKALSMERRIAGSRALSPWSVNQMYVTKLAGATAPAATV
jgi:SAM-dependent methyltransferase